jgi:hypothetical protein
MRSTLLIATLITSAMFAPAAAAQPSAPKLYVEPSTVEPGGHVTVAVSNCVIVFDFVKSPGFEGGEIKFYPGGGTSPYGHGLVVKTPGKYTAETFCKNIGNVVTADFTVAEKPTTTTPPPPSTPKPTTTTTKPPRQQVIKPRGAPETGDGTLN